MFLSSSIFCIESFWLTPRLLTNTSYVVLFTTFVTYTTTMPAFPRHMPWFTATKTLHFLAVDDDAARCPPKLWSASTAMPCSHHPLQLSASGAVPGHQHRCILLCSLHRHNNLHRLVVRQRHFRQQSLLSGFTFYDTHKSVPKNNHSMTHQTHNTLITVLN